MKDNKELNNNELELITGACQDCICYTIFDDIRMSFPLGAALDECECMRKCEGMPVYWF